MYINVLVNGNQVNCDDTILFLFEKTNKKLRQLYLYQNLTLYTCKFVEKKQPSIIRFSPVENEFFDLCFIIYDFIVFIYPSKIGFRSMYANYYYAYGFVIIVKVVDKYHVQVYTERFFGNSIFIVKLWINSNYDFCNF